MASVSLREDHLWADAEDELGRLAGLLPRLLLRSLPLLALLLLLLLPPLQQQIIPGYTMGTASLVVATKFAYLSTNTLNGKIKSKSKHTRHSLKHPLSLFWNTLTSSNLFKAQQIFTATMLHVPSFHAETFQQRSIKLQGIYVTISQIITIY